MIISLAAIKGGVGKTVLSQKVEKDRITLWLSNFKELQSQRATRQISFGVKHPFYASPST